MRSASTVSIALLGAVLALAPGCKRGTKMVRCSELRGRFAAELAKQSGSCSTDADCACHGAEGGGCGGVTDAETARRLEPIAKEFHAAGCNYEVQCAAWMCRPKCVSGRCSQ